MREKRVCTRSVTLKSQESEGEEQSSPPQSHLHEDEVGDDEDEGEGAVAASEGAVAASPCCSECRWLERAHASACVGQPARALTSPPLRKDSRKV